MHRSLPSIAAAVAIVASAALTNRAGAMTMGNPSGIVALIEELALIDQVHCVPGYPHHRPTAWNRRDGCVRRRVIVPPVVIVPPRIVIPGPRWCHRWRTSRRFRC
jgi:hypothetical protein